MLDYEFNNPFKNKLLSENAKIRNQRYKENGE